MINNEYIVKGFTCMITMSAITGRGGRIYKCKTCGAETQNVINAVDLRNKLMAHLQSNSACRKYFYLTLSFQ